MGLGLLDEHGRITTLQWLEPEDGLHTLAARTTDTICLGKGDESNLGANCKILDAIQDRCKRVEQVGATLMGPVASMNYVCRSCACNAHNALCNRHGKKAPPCTADFTEYKAWLEENVYEQFKSRYVELISHYRDGGHWIAKWPALKQDAIEESDKWDRFSPERVKCMIKRESSNKPPSKARLIQFYRTLKTQSFRGPEFTALQKALTESINTTDRLHAPCNDAGDSAAPDVSVTFGSGKNAYELGEWMSTAQRNARGRRCTYYERDGKNWDATMQQAAQEMRESLYAEVDDSLAAFAKQCSKVRGSGIFNGVRLRYKLDYTVKSGHNDTTIGNNIVNAGISFSCMKKLGLSGAILVVGDDLLIVVYGDFDEDAFASLEATYGIVPEYRKFHAVCDVSFISALWFVTSTGYAFTPKPGRLLARLFWTTNPPPPKQATAYIKGVVLGLWPTVSNMPVIGKWLEKTYQLYGCGDVAEVWDNRSTVRKREFNEGNTPFDSVARSAFLDRYQILECEVADCEAMIERMTTPFTYMAHPVLTRLLTVDNADIMDRVAEGNY